MPTYGIFSSLGNGSLVDVNVSLWPPTHCWYSAYVCPFGLQTVSMTMFHAHKQPYKNRKCGFSAVLRAFVANVPQKRAGYTLVSLHKLHFRSLAKEVFSPLCVV